MTTDTATVRPPTGVALDHTIVAATDAERSARYLSGLLGLPEPERMGPFMAVPLGNGTTLDYVTTTDDVVSQHYAFRVTTEVFDQAFRRIQETEQTYWADPGRRHEGELNARGETKGFYFLDPDGHFLELIAPS